MGAPDVGVSTVVPDRFDRLDAAQANARAAAPPQPTQVVVERFTELPPARRIGRVERLHGQTAFVQNACRAAFVDRIALLAEIADGKGKRVLTTKKLGIVAEVLTESPSHRDRLQAMALLAKYGGLDRAIDGPPEMDEGQMMQAFIAALRDPGVRQYIQQVYPDLMQTLAEAFSPRTPPSPSEGLLSPETPPDVQPEEGLADAIA